MVSDAQPYRSAKSASLDGSAGVLLAAPLRQRVVAFGIDLALILVLDLLFTWVDGSDSASLVSLAVTFIGYHTALPWLTGSTVGKALLGLRLRHVTGVTYERRLIGLLWVFFRASIGYLVVDVGGLVGLLVAAKGKQHRPLHDFVFRSQVVQEGRLSSTWATLGDYADDLEGSLEHVRPRSRVLRLLRWLWSGVAALHLLRTLVRRVLRWLRADSRPLPAPPTTLSGTQTSAVVATSLVCTLLLGTAANNAVDGDARPEVATGGRQAAAPATRDGPSASADPMEEVLAKLLAPSDLEPGQFQEPSTYRMDTQARPYGCETTSDHRMTWIGAVWHDLSAGPSGVDYAPHGTAFQGDVLVHEQVVLFSSADDAAAYVEETRLGWADHCGEQYEPRPIRHNEWSGYESGANFGLQFAVQRGAIVVELLYSAGIAYSAALADDPDVIPDALLDWEAASIQRSRQVLSIALDKLDQP